MKKWWELWHIEQDETRFSIWTPLFSFHWYDGGKHFDTRSYQWGWELYFSPNIRCVEGGVYYTKSVGQTHRITPEHIKDYRIPKSMWRRRAMEGMT